MCYRSLVKQLPPEQAVIALDDASLTAALAKGGASDGLDFGFRSVEQAASAVVRALASLKLAKGARVVLGGWSYGGVVAVQAAAQLAESGSSGDSSRSVPLGVWCLWTLMCGWREARPSLQRVVALVTG